LILNHWLEQASQLPNAKARREEERMIIEIFKEPG